MEKWDPNNEKHIFTILLVVCVIINFDILEYLCFQRDEHLPFAHVDCESVSYSVVSDSLGPMDCSPPGSSVHRVLQASVLEWIAISFSRGSSQPRD